MAAPRWKVRSLGCRAKYEGRRMMSFKDGSNRKQSRLASCLLLALLSFGSGQGAQAADNEVRAFYFNHKGKLLQVELVDQGKMSLRTLEDADQTEIEFPQLNGKALPKVTGTNKPMKRLATVAVYYSYKGGTPDEDAQDVQAVPVKVEDLHDVDDRTLETCLARDGSDPCPFPKRCHCMTGSCCCY